MLHRQQVLGLDGPRNNPPAIIVLMESARVYHRPGSYIHQQSATETTAIAIATLAVLYDLGYSRNMRI